MNLSNLKVGTRLSIGYSLVLAFLCIITAGSLFGMTRMRESTRVITDINNIQIELANNLADSIHQRMVLVRNLGLLTDTGAMAVEYRAIKEETGKYADTYKKMEPLFNLPETQPEEKRLFAQLREAEQAALPIIEKASRHGLANEAEQATRVLMDELRPVQAKWIGTIRDLITLENKLNQEASTEALHAYEETRALNLGLAAIALVIGVLAAVLVTRSLLRQLGGEPGYAADVAVRIANGDLATPVEVKAGDTTSMMAAMKTMRDKLADIVSQVRTGTDMIASASTQVASGNQDLSSRTEEQASSLEETASSMEELTSTVKQNADNARQANLMADAASNVAQKGGVAINEVMSTMSDISASASKIRDIIGVIDGIAFQTNILALNAAVEAARAGEQGRGFAVVATEVRNLAQRSAGAAREIKELIEDSSNKVESGSRQVGAASTTILEVVDSVKRVTDIMTEISAASQEQTAGIEQINQAIVSMDQVTQQNAALVEEAAAASEAMQVQAARLTDAVSLFRLDSTQRVAEAAREPVKAPRTTAPHAAPAAQRRQASPARIASQPKAPATLGVDGWETF
jgi:methyl-accepting chemotaxis protein